MLINFNLAPIKEIEPWGKGEQPGLSWFGLTQGEYWIELGESTLFEYDEKAWPDGMRHCEYPVARLHEDLMDMLPSILEPVPAALVPYLFGDGAAACWDAWTNWCDRHAAALGKGHALEIENALLALTAGRQHIAHYLTPSTRFVAWSDAENVYFAWDNRHALIHGHPAWTAQYGEFQMPRREFIEEMQSFHARLMEQMAERVEQVLIGALPPSIYIDIDRLAHEQSQRYEALHEALNIEAQTDWQAVESAVSEILKVRQAA
jgi:hypothetical protein